MEKTIFIKNRKGIPMSIKLNISPERNKLVFLEHGLGARKEYPHMLVMENVFAANGYNIVNIDTTDSLNESGSSEEGATFTGYIEDLEDVINWAKNQDFYIEPFALGGQSLGAGSSIYYAGKFPSEVSLVISAAFPWINGAENIKHNEKVETILKNGYYDQVSKSTGRVLRIKIAYLEDMRKHNLAEIAKRISADTYLIIGLKDTEWHIDNNKRLYELLTCKKELVLLPDVPHDLANTPENKAAFTEALIEILKR